MRRITWFFFINVAIIFSFNTCTNNKKVSPALRILVAYKLALKELGEESKKFVSLVERKSATADLQHQFFKARSAFKKVEWLAEYYYPTTSKKINGPALQEAEADEKSIIIQPEGFQVIEEIIFDSTAEYPDQSLLLKEAMILSSNINRLNYMASIQETTDANIFDALRLELFRIISLGLTGFDSPIAGNSLNEAASSIEAVHYYLSFYKGKINDRENLLYNALDSLFIEAKHYLSEAKSFDSFDRLLFIKAFLNPLSEKIYLVQKELQITFFNEPRALAAEAKNLFAAGVFNADYYAPEIQSYSTPGKIRLGKKLFYDGILSGNGKVSCATCHQPGKAFTDGLKTSKGINAQAKINRNAPTLLNAAMQPSLFYDLRVNYLEDQATDVVSNQNEMHGSFKNALKYIDNNREYKQLLREVYDNDKPTDLHLRNAIAAYVRSLTVLNSKFDRYMRGQDDAINQEEINGFNLFTGKAKCATCHFLPLFNGANPPQFNKVDAEVIGVPASPDSLNPVLDSDEGKYSLYKINLHKNSFKTPTIRNVELTAPYMHNGVFQSLEEVVDFYNKGGGTGLGLELPNQTLPPEKLNLNAPEKKSLIAFMKTLTDTVTIKSY